MTFSKAKGVEQKITFMRMTCVCGSHVGCCCCGEDGPEELGKPILSNPRRAHANLTMLYTQVCVWVHACVRLLNLAFQCAGASLFCPFLQQSRVLAVRDTYYYSVLTCPSMSLMLDAHLMSHSCV